MIGMVLAVPGSPSLAQLGLGTVARAGYLVGGRGSSSVQLHRGANHRFQDEAHRLAPTARGELSNQQTLLFSVALCAWAR